MKALVLSLLSLHQRADGFAKSLIGIIDEELLRLRLWNVWWRRRLGAADYRDDRQRERRDCKKRGESYTAC